jgi:hypothetical protein
MLNAATAMPSVIREKIPPKKEKMNLSTGGVLIFGSVLLIAG